MDGDVVVESESSRQDFSKCFWGRWASWSVWFVSLSVERQVLRFSEPRVEVRLISFCSQGGFQRPVIAASAVRRLRNRSASGRLALVRLEEGMRRKQHTCEG